MTDTTDKEYGSYIKAVKSQSTIVTMKEKVKIALYNHFNHGGIKRSEIRVLNGNIVRKLTLLTTYLDMLYTIVPVLTITDD